MESPNKVQELIGERIRTLREGRRMSLSALAQRSGLSKGIVSTLEDGRGNPTINTVWRLAEALGVPFGELTRQEGDGSRKQVGTEGISVHLIEQSRVEKLVETYLLQLAPNTLREAEPHPWGVEERILVARGLLLVGESAFSRHLQPGEDLLFPGDRPHFYQSGQDPVTAVVTITYPSTTPTERDKAPPNTGSPQG
ncbi:MAG: helix-turn-helix transcriptional regulator [Desulfohalobiaceae bacterium]